MHQLPAFEGAAMAMDDTGALREDRKGSSGNAILSRYPLRGESCRIILFPDISNENYFGLQDSG